ncbi:MAG: hypothetical protein B7X86_14295 [Sphingobacteriales bacterium 17-39-43]|uniref:hypothetical protein n=1 Tax=Daejeonella sp. TaxID=2805397 RepID=UPI000BD79568|nr:hypothetical protein [Daejeonella sp.]OYZ30119.1 MAG: hypothetical protein B7Y24_14060 [Sphingobacteriales bacterium 16-39-50]OZA22837.1 MAG: hypothetical protein B7X86_14295 [Sphingobacteriales bacterium 17-39-43]HQT24012.1 hypothetical protein [Daejeonella sp.]HQT58676.1 hypothetical protein [Daejeonella sp.]
MTELKTHWRIVDYRVKSLFVVMEGLHHSISELEKQVKLGGWYDGDWFLEEIEPIYGLGFIALQHYINGSIKDRYNTDDTWRFYHTSSAPKGFSIPTVELIVTLANYAKHMEDSKVTKRTSDCLKHFELYSEGPMPIEESPIFKGIELLSPTWDLKEVMQNVINWRALIWKLP